jgi:hypothetical protein
VAGDDGVEAVVFEPVAPQGQQQFSWSRHDRSRILNDSVS